MDIEKLRNWLKTNGKDRAWLAEKCGVSKHTVDGWFAGRQISGPAKAAVERVLAGPPTIGDLKMSLDEWQQIQDRAAHEGVGPLEWIARVIKASLALAPLAYWFAPRETSAAVKALLAWF